MLPALADENFSHRILRGIRLRIQNPDIVVAQNTGLCGATDETLLAWAADHGRIMLTHDRQTIPKHAYDRIRSGQHMPGIIVVLDTMPIGNAIDALTMYLECGSPEEFENLVIFLL
jgi:hypothetical protein